MAKDEDSEGVRLYVVYRSRDCDGTPLYYLSTDRSDIQRENPGFFNPRWINGYGEESLQVLPTKE